MKYCAKSLIWIGLITLLKCQVANAAVHNISQGQLPICNNWNNSWSISGSTYTCSASVSFVAGDEYVANSPITLRADAGITLSGNKIGSVASPIALQTTYGTLNATVGSSVIYGNLSTGSGALTLTGVSLTGNIQTSAKLTITQSAINGNVSGTGEGVISGSSVSGTVNFGNGFAGSDTTFASSVSSTVISLKNGSVSGSISGTNITLDGTDVDENITGTVISSTNGSVSGSISGTNITLNGTNVDGKVTGTGTGSFTNLTIGNNVSMTNGLIATNAVFSSTLTSTNGSVNLTGGSVAGLVNVACCKVTISQGAVISNGIVSGDNGIDIRDSTVAGDLKAGNNPIVMVNVNMTSGTISPGNSSLTITGGTVTADVTNAHRVFISNNAVVTGDVLARYEVRVSDSKVVGDIETVVGHDGLHHVYLTNSEVYGNVTVRDDWGTINGDELSRIYGECTYKLVDPISLCEAGGGPGPIDPVECKVELQVEHMVAGTQQKAKVVIKDQAECKRPDKLDFAFDYKSPEDPPVKLNIFLNGGAMEDKRGTASLDFAGGNEALLDIQYEEVGRLSLRIDAEDQAEKLFVSRPARLSLSAAGALSCNPQDTFDEENCRKFKAAGELFDLEVRAFNAKNEEVGNFEHSLALQVMSEGVDKFYPRDGQEPKVTKGAPEQFIRNLTNKKITPQLSISDVGIVKIKAVIKDYLGSGHEVSGESEFIGRFIPAWLEVSGAASLNSCDGFSYQRELVPYDVFPRLMVTGKNRQGSTTKNYDRGDFWRLSSALSSTWWTLDGERELTAKLSFPGQDSALNDAEDGDGQREYEWSGDGLKYDSASPTPGADDLPFSILQRFSATALTDADGVCHMAGTGACQSYELPYEASEIRLGRLRIGNAHGSELQPLSLPWTIESWRVLGVFLAETEDVCSAPKWSEPNLSDATGELAAGSLPSVSSDRSGYQGQLLLASPQRRGSVRAGFPDVPEWLWYDWHGEGQEASRGLATFGIYQGPKPLIFRREVYR